jgi:putative component of membrane protein insertase Oxa1/YidC/SpoIIIJ protein YidD
VDLLLPMALIVVVSVFVFYNPQLLVFGLGFYLLFRLKRIVLWSILLYQKYANEDVRSSCVFVPSCSQYMLEAIEKYGLIAGVVKGWDRLNRCHHENAGEDPVD